MKKRRRISIFLRVVVVATTLLFSGAQGSDDAMRHEPGPAVMIYADPLTGEIIDAPAAANLAPSLAIQRKAAQPSARPLPGGGVKIDASSLALSYAVATVDSQGRVHSNCVRVEPRVQGEAAK